MYICRHHFRESFKNHTVPDDRSRILEPLRNNVNVKVTLSVFRSRVPYVLMAVIPYFQCVWLKSRLENGPNTLNPCFCH